MPRDCCGRELPLSQVAVAATHLVVVGIFLNLFGFFHGCARTLARFALRARAQRAHIFSQGQEGKGNVLLRARKSMHRVTIARVLLVQATVPTRPRLSQ